MIAESETLVYGRYGNSLNPQSHTAHKEIWLVCVREGYPVAEDFHDEVCLGASL